MGHHRSGWDGRTPTLCEQTSHSENSDQTKDPTKHAAKNKHHLCGIQTLCYRTCRAGQRLPVAVLARVMHASGSSSQLIHLLRGCVAVSWVMLLFACIAVAAFVLILSKRQSASLTLQVHSIYKHSPFPAWHDGQAQYSHEKSVSGT